MVWTLVRLVYRRFRVLFVLAMVLGGSVGYFAAGSVSESAPATVFEGSIEALILSEEESLSLARAVLHEQSFGTHVVFFFAGDSGRAQTLWTALRTPSIESRLAESSGFLPEEWRERITMEEPKTSNMLGIKIWGESEKQVDTLLTSVTSELISADEKFFPESPGVQVIDRVEKTPELSTDSQLSTLRDWKRNWLENTLQNRPYLVGPDLDFWAAKVEARIANSRSLGVATFSQHHVNVSGKPPNRLTGRVQGESEVAVVEGIENVALIFEQAGQTAPSVTEPSRIVVITQSDVVQTLPAAISLIDRRPVTALSGAFLGIMVVLLLAANTFSRRRILWGPNQLFSIVRTAPIAVLTRSGGFRDAKVVPTTSQGIQTLATNLLATNDGPNLVALATLSDEADFLIEERLAETFSRRDFSVAIATVDSGTIRTGLRTPNRVAPSSSLESSNPAQDGHSVDFSEEAGVGLFTLHLPSPDGRGWFLSESWKRLIQRVTADFDLLLVSLTRLLDDQGGFEAIADLPRVVLIVQPGVTRIDQLESALVRIEQAGGPPPDVVVVGVPRRDVTFWHRAPNGGGGFRRDSAQDFVQ